MKYILLFENYNSGKLYINSEYDINTQLPYSSTTIMNYTTKLYNVYKNLPFYKKIASRSYSSYNYIYQINNANLFDFSKKDFLNISKICPSWMPTMKRYFSLNIEDDKIIDYIINYIDGNYKRSNMNDILSTIKFDDINDIEIFKNNYDGIIYTDKYYVFEKTLHKSTLVNGNVKKYGRSSLNKKDLPEHIIEDLIRYTDNPQKKLKKETIEYLKNHSVKSNEDIYLYRGFALEIFEYGDYETESSMINNPVKLNTFLKKRIGTSSFEDLTIGSPLTISRGKESSWSYNAEVAKGFYSGMASGDINLLVKTLAKPSDVLIDFTLLSENDRKKFKYIHQNEVILNIGKYQTIINEMSISNYFKNYLADKTNLKFVKGKGIVEK